jgi:hypothetical protein
MKDRVSRWEFAEAQTSWAPAAIVSGALWAVYGVRAGFRPDAYFALLAGGGLSVWLLLVAMSELGKDRRTLEAVLPAATLTLLALTGFGRWLLDATHHRALGAVTFAFATLAVFAVSWLVFARRQVPLAVGALGLAAASAWVLVLLLPFGLALVEPLIGLALTLVVFLLGERVRVRSSGLALACSGSLISGALIAVWLAPVVVNHAFILGLPGLLR